MMIYSADLTEFFELSARRLGVTPIRLADIVNNFNDMTMRDWDQLAVDDDIEISDIEGLRAGLLELMNKAKHH